MQDCGISLDLVKDKMVSRFVIAAEGICADCVTFSSRCHARDRKIDRILTSKLTGIPIMLLLLMLIFWLTISGANYPSQLLSDGFFSGAGSPHRFFPLDASAGMAAWYIGFRGVPGSGVGGFRDAAAYGDFFPAVYSARGFWATPVAFNLDKYFKKANACGKQALTMCIDFIILLLRIHAPVDANLIAIQPNRFNNTAD